MGLTASEVRRIKYELGYGLLSVAAEPYISYVSLFDQIIQPYLTAGSETTSTSTITAVGSPTPAALVLANASGYTAGDRVIVDVDDRQESATVQSVSGNTIVCLLSNAHSGMYRVEVEGGVSIVRSILRKLQAIGGLGAAASKDAIMAALKTAGIKKVDEVEFFGDGPMGYRNTRIAQVEALREYWRDELASSLQIVRLNSRGSGGGGGSVSMY